MASENIGSLVARVVADNEQFRGEMLRMTRQLESNTARMNRSLARVNTGMSAVGAAARTAGRLMATFGVALSIRALTQFASRTIQSARELQSLAVRLGSSTEALSELQYVAEQSDVQFSVLSLGLQRMTRRIAEAAEGTGEAKGALRELGLDAMALARLPLDEQFQEVAQRLSEVEGESHRVRLAMKLFDSEGVALLQTMQGGAMAIRAMRNEARELGITLDTGSAESAAKAAKETDKFKAAASTLARELTLNLVPALTSAVEWARRFVFPTATEQRAKEMLDATLRVVDLRNELQGLNEDLESALKIRNPSARTETFIDGLRQRIIDTRTELKVLEDSIEAFNARQRELASAATGGGGGGAGFGSDGLSPFSVSSPKINEALLEAQRVRMEQEEAFTGFIKEQHDQRVTSAVQAASRESQATLESVQSQLSFRSDLAQSSAQLLYALLGEQKAVALAAIAFEKLQAVRRVKIAVEQAAWLAFASQLVPGDPSSLARAQAARTAVRAQGAASVARTIALSVVGGLAEAAQVLGSRGGPGSFTNPLSVTAGTSLAGGSAQGAAPRESSVQLYFQGDVNGWDRYIEDRVITAIRNAVDGRDVVIIGPESRQAKMLA